MEMGFGGGDRLERRKREVGNGRRRKTKGLEGENWKFVYGVEEGSERTVGGGGSFKDLIRTGKGWGVGGGGNESLCSQG
jgi:hypothetical protein